MPSNTLLLLHSLLSQLGISIKPPTISSIPPLLLLLALETILDEKLPIPAQIRRCDTEEDSLSLIKILLGILSDDLLQIDLSLINPVKVLEGSERELEVLIMGLVVVAKKRGISVGSSTKGDDSVKRRSRDSRYGGINIDQSMECEEEDSLEMLQQPLKPDISFTSPPSTSQLPYVDIFGANYDISTESTLNDIIDQHDPIENRQKHPRYIDREEGYNNYIDVNDISKISDEFDPYITPIHKTFHFNRDTNLLKDDICKRDFHSDLIENTTTNTMTTSTSGKTVLQLMLEEFGLDPG